MSVLPSTGSIRVAKFKERQGRRRIGAAPFRSPISSNAPIRAAFCTVSHKSLRCAKLRISRHPVVRLSSPPKPASSPRRSKPLPKIAYEETIAPHPLKRFRNGTNMIRKPSRSLRGAVRSSDRRSSTKAVEPNLDPRLASLVRLLARRAARAWYSEQTGKSGAKRP